MVSAFTARAAAVGGTEKAVAAGKVDGRGPAACVGQWAVRWPRVSLARVHERVQRERAGARCARQLALPEPLGHAHHRRRARAARRAPAAVAGA